MPAPEIPAPEACNTAPQARSAESDAERHNNQYSYHIRKEWYALASDQACPSCRHDRRQVRAEGKSEMMSVRAK
jgi:hypothetical protein